jgi:hypothetical protein
MERIERRRKRLQMLIKEAGSQPKLAEKAERFAGDLTPTANWISQLMNSRPISDDYAAVFERAMNKPEGWLDQWLPEEGALDPPATPKEIDLIAILRKLQDFDKGQVYREAAKLLDASAPTDAKDRQVC